MVSRCLNSLALMTVLSLTMAELYSDVDSKENDEAKALDIKAKDFWKGIMANANELETTDNARLGAAVDKALANLPPEDNDIHDLFQTSIGHLAEADSMLIQEAIVSKKKAAQRLEHGPSKEAFYEIASDWKGVFSSALARFIGHKTYEKRLATQIISRLKDIKPYLHQGFDLVPHMLDESSKASDRAYEILRSRDGSGHSLPLELQELAHQIIRATGKQRLRFTNYLLGSLMTTAVDVAGKDESASNTVTKANLRGVDWSGASKNSVSFDASSKVPRISSEPGVKEEEPMMFVGGVPVDAEPITRYTSNAERVVEV